MTVAMKTSKADTHDVPVPFTSQSDTTAVRPWAHRYYSTADTTRPNPIGGVSEPNLQGPSQTEAVDGVGQSSGKPGTSQESIQVDHVLSPIATYFESPVVVHNSPPSPDLESLYTTRDSEESSREGLGTPRSSTIFPSGLPQSSPDRRNTIAISNGAVSNASTKLPSTRSRNGLLTKLFPGSASRKGLGTTRSFSISSAGLTSRYRDSDEQSLMSNHPLLGNLPVQKATTSRVAGLAGLGPPHRKVGSSASRAAADGLGLAISSDGRLVVTTDRNGTVVLREFRSESTTQAVKDRILFMPETEKGYFMDFSNRFSPDDHFLASAYLWQLSLPWEEVEGRASRHERTSSLRVINMQTFEIVYSLRRDEGLQFKFSTDGQLLAVAAQGSVILVDTSSWTTVNAITSPSRVASFDLSFDNQRLITSTIDWDLKIHDIATGESLADMVKTKILASRPDDLLLVRDRASKVLWLYNPKEATARSYLSGDLSPYTFSADGMVVASRSDSLIQELKIIEPTTGAILSGLKVKDVVNFCLSANGRYLAVVREDRSVKVWELNLELLRSLPPGASTRR